MPPPSLPSFQGCFRTLRGVWGWLHLQLQLQPLLLANPVFMVKRIVLAAHATALIFS